MKVHAAEERRKATRTRTQQQVTIRFTRDGHSELTGTARDVSANGIFVELEADIVVQTDVELLLTLPTQSGEVSPTIRGNVVRVERSSVGVSGIAIAFTIAA